MAVTDWKREPMEIQIDDDFDLDKIADSGQCFRWEKQDKSSAILNATSIASYRIIAGRECLYITALGDGRYELDCTEDKYSNYWLHYFDLHENYRDIRNRIDPERIRFYGKRRNRNREFGFCDRIHGRC